MEIQASTICYIEQLYNKRNCLFPTTHSRLITQDRIISHQGVMIPLRTWQPGSTNTQKLLAGKDSIYYYRPSKASIAKESKADYNL